MGRDRKKGNPEGAREERESRLRAELKAVQETVNKIRAQLKLEPVSIPDEDRLSRKLMKSLGNCPRCGGADLNVSDYDGDGIRELTCRVECNDCEAEWGEKYHFMGAWWINKGNRDESDPVDEEDEDE